MFFIFIPSESKVIGSIIGCRLHSYPRRM